MRGKVSSPKITVPHGQKLQGEGHGSRPLWANWESAGDRRVGGRQIQAGAELSIGDKRKEDNVDDYGVQLVTRMRENG